MPWPSPPGFDGRRFMLGVLAATLANHCLAVVAGNYLTHFIPLVHLRAAASASFIVFGMWGLYHAEFSRG